MRLEGKIVARHRRNFGRDQVIYDPWHYLPVLQRKPGALRNGAPFRDWDLPDSLRRVRNHFEGLDDGDRQMVKVLNAVLTDSLTVKHATASAVLCVTSACETALSAGTISADIILNLVSRDQEPETAKPINTPVALELKQPPQADCQRYDALRQEVPHATA